MRSLKHDYVLGYRWGRLTERSRRNPYCGSLDVCLIELYMSYVIKYQSDTYGMKTTTVVNVIPNKRDKKPSECNILNRNHSFGNIRYERLVGIWQRKTAFNQ